MIYRAFVLVHAQSRSETFWPTVSTGRDFVYKLFHFLKGILRYTVESQYSEPS